MIRFEKSGYRFEIEAQHIDEYRNLLVTGKVNGTPFAGRYHEVQGRRVIEFWKPITVGGRKIGGVEPIGEAKAELDRLLDEGRARQAAEAEAYASAEPGVYRIALGGDTEHVYVWPEDVARPAYLPMGTTNRAADEVERRIARLRGGRKFELFGLGEPVETRVGRQARVVSAEELLAALARLEAESEAERAEAHRSLGLRAEGATLGEDEPDARPVVVRRCWECGRMYIAHVPEGVDRREVERWVAEGHRRALEGAGDEPLASVGFRPEPAPWRVVTETFYCGC